MAPTAETGGGGGLLRRLFLLPEANLLFFGFLVHYPWEFLQVPLFEGMAEAPHWEAIQFCSRAAAGDGLITVLAFWVAAAAAGGRRWLFRPSARVVAVYLAAGLLVTVVLEWLNTEVLGRWQYAPEMPTLPLLGIGLSPLVQWLVLPLLVLGIVRRQLGAAAVPGGEQT